MTPAHSPAPGTAGPPAAGSSGPSASAAGYGPDLADVYDLVYAGRGKDYAAEAAEVVALIRARRPAARSLLDVACGSGGHLGHFAAALGAAEGLELSAYMIDRARHRAPDLRVHHGDMRDFALGRAYSAVTCMFSSIGYLPSAADLDGALAAFARHLEPGGVIVIEPWYTPDRFLPGYVASDLVRTDERTVVRLSHSTRDGVHVPIIAHYLVADRAHGVHHFTDVHPMTLFTDAEYRAAFGRAGCAVAYVPSDRFPCGLYVGVRD
ncbi:hypothetical protein GCM10010123_28180 [Pilimelia anulata]|uniref:Methyltransferase domain-containing protein n=1 Tax=Pilimelia anulata TaxID=53371 RepID=A0A8J3BDK9_9ACTN|nr:class I SAM-dependent methyltransferase [Pilimelia anulata]GGJ96579.1 hypothetical protein GCM10010123_28180 [Pilimelia anulata]